MGVWYTTRENVKSVLDIKETARSNAQVDRAIESGSRAVEGLLHRRFYPWTGTRYKDWPDSQQSLSWRLWLDQDELISLASITSGGNAIALGDVNLEPANDGPPYTYIELDIGTSTSFDGGDTHQRNVALTGVFGHSNDEMPAGTVTEALDTSETSVDISDSSLVGVGSIIRIDNERMRVTGRTFADTAVDIHASDSMTASAADVSIVLSTATAAPQPGEVILIDSERMLVVDIASTTLTVKRAWDGSVLATHSASASIFAPRTVVVERGALGTTAAAHDTATAIVRWEPPGLVETLAAAYSINTLLQQSAGYARISGSGDNAKEFTGRGIKALEADAKARYGRKARTMAV